MQEPKDTIKFVKEYLADRPSKTQEEVRANFKAATATYAAADYASYASYAAYAVSSAADAAHWVKKYEELTNAKT